MPLRNHFDPRDQDPSWEGFHSMWTAVIAQQLNRQLPPQYRAVSQTKHGSQIEIDVATFALANGDSGQLSELPLPESAGNWTINWPDRDLFEIRVFDTSANKRLVGAIELVSPANKDRFSTRTAFAGKCAGYLRNNVGLIVVDVVTHRHFDLHRLTLELLEFDTPPHPWNLGDPPIYAAAYRTFIVEQGQIEIWPHALTLGEELPTIPLWLSSEYYILINLESSYQTTCSDLRM